MLLHVDWLPNTEVNFGGYVFCSNLDIWIRRPRWIWQMIIRNVSRQVSVLFVVLRFDRVVVPQYVRWTGFKLFSEFYVSNFFFLDLLFRWTSFQGSVVNAGVKQTQYKIPSWEFYLFSGVLTLSFELSSINIYQNDGLFLKSVDFMETCCVSEAAFIPISLPLLGVLHHWSTTHGSGQPSYVFSCCSVCVAVKRYRVMIDTNAVIVPLDIHQ